MSNEFTASNGIKIRSRGYPYSIEMDSGFEENHWDSVGEYVEGTLMDAAMAEWYQHRRDEELGRWRDPETGLLIYPAGTMTAGTNRKYRAVQVLDETLPHFTLIHEGDLTSKRRRRAERKEIEAAARYFAAHPEPKPWQNAELGDVWELEIEDVPTAAYVFVGEDDDYVGGMFVGPRIDVGASGSAIKSGRKVYPQ